MVPRIQQPGSRQRKNGCRADAGENESGGVRVASPLGSRVVLGAFYPHQKGFQSTGDDVMSETIEQVRKGVSQRNILYTQDVTLGRIRYRPPNIVVSGQPGPRIPRCWFVSIHSSRVSIHHPRWQRTDSSQSFRFSVKVVRVWSGILLGVIQNLGGFNVWCHNRI